MMWDGQAEWDKGSTKIFFYACESPFLGKIILKYDVMALSHLNRAFINILKLFLSDK